jgi:BMFP domain-containing protein YqiC
MVAKARAEADGLQARLEALEGRVAALEVEAKAPPPIDGSMA